MLRKTTPKSMALGERMSWFTLSVSLFPLAVKSKVEIK